MNTRLKCAGLACLFLAACSSPAPRQTAQPQPAPMPYTMPYATTATMPMQGQYSYPTQTLAAPAAPALPSTAAPAQTAGLTPWPAQWQAPQQAAPQLVGQSVTTTTYPYAYPAQPMAGQQPLQAVYPSQLQAQYSGQLPAVMPAATQPPMAPPDAVAAQMAQQARPYQPSSPAAAQLYSRGNQDMAAGDVAGAQKDYEDELKINPFDPIALNNLAVASAQQGRVQTALDLLDRAAHLAPGNPVIIANQSRLRAYYNSYAAMGMSNGTLPQAHFDVPPPPPDLWMKSAVAAVPVAAPAQAPVTAGTAQ